MPPTKANDELAKLQRQLSVQRDIVDKLRLIRALHIAAYNSTKPVETFSIEFFHLVGDILEGQKATELTIKLIDRDAVLQEYNEA